MTKIRKFKRRIDGKIQYLPNCFGNFGAGCFLAFLPGPIGVASVDHLRENLFFLPITTEDNKDSERFHTRTTRNAHTRVSHSNREPSLSLNSGVDVTSCMCAHIVLVLMLPKAAGNLFPGSSLYLEEGRDRTLGTRLGPTSQVFTIRTDPKPTNNILFFSSGKLAYKWFCCCH